MTKRKDLKRKLKAADRRRKQRSGDSVLGRSNESVPTSTVTTDVVDLLGSAILSFSNSDPLAADVVVLAALRSCQKGSTPSGAEANTLCSEFNRIKERENVSLRSFRGAIDQMASILIEHQDAENPKSFLNYLSLIAS